MTTDELIAKAKANMAKLPSFVAVMRPGIGGPRVYVIEKGHGTRPVACVCTADHLNKICSTTPAEIAAMEAGNSRGWWGPWADPDNYDEKGEYNASK